MKRFFRKLGQSVVGRKGIGGTLTVVIILAVVMLNILAYTLTAAFGLYLYSPQEDDLSISGNTDALFEEHILKGKKVKITFCYPESTLENHDTGKFVLTTAREFEKRYPELIELKFVNLITKLDENLTPVDFEQYKDGGRYTINQSSVIFECGEGEHRSIRVLTDTSTSAGFIDFYTLDSSLSISAYNGEEVMAAMISWVLHDEHPTVYFTQNHGETADVAFSNLLSCAGYYVEVINLRKDEIPADAGMIIISNPTNDFEKAKEGSGVRGEIDKLEAYLERGGKLYVALDTYVKELKNLEGMLAKWGIALSGEYNDNGQLVRDIVKENSNAITPDGYTFVATHADNDKSNEIYGKLSAFSADRVLISQATALELDEALGAHPLLISGSTSSTYAGGKLTDNEGGYSVAAYSSRTHGDNAKSTVVVIPTAYITAADAFISDGYSNKDFIYATFEVLFDSNPAPYGCNNVIYDTKVLENFTMGRAKAYTAIIMAIPVILTVVGTVIIVRRKNR